MPAAPAPLTAAQQELVAANRGLCGHVVKLYFYNYRRDRVLWDKINGAAVLGLIAAVRAFKQNHCRAGYRLKYIKLKKPVRFNTYAGTSIWSHCTKCVNAYMRTPDELRNIRSLRNRHQNPTDHTIIDIDPIDTRSAPIEFASHGERAALITAALGILSPTARAIIVSKFGLEGTPPQSSVQIGARLGMTHKSVEDQARRALAELKLGFAGRTLARATCA